MRILLMIRAMLWELRAWRAWLNIPIRFSEHLHRKIENCTFAQVVNEQEIRIQQYDFAAIYAHRAWQDVAAGWGRSHVRQAQDGAINARREREERRRATRINPE